MPKKKIPTDGGESLTHNPFAGLGGLGELPEAPAPEPTRPAVETPRAEPGSETIRTKLVVRRQRKGHGGKTVTIVEGLPSDRLETLAKQARKALGRGARVEGEELVVAGAQHEQVADWLERQGASKVVLGN